MDSCVRRVHELVREKRGESSVRLNAIGENVDRAACARRNCVRLKVTSPRERAGRAEAVDGREGRARRGRRVAADDMYAGPCGSRRGRCLVAAAGVKRGDGYGKGAREWQIRQQRRGRSRALGGRQLRSGYGAASAKGAWRRLG